MKKIYTKTVAVIMLVVMALSALSLSSFAATEKLHSSKRTVNTICYIGDSIGAGYGLDGDIDALSTQLSMHNGELVEGSYPYLVSKAVNAKHSYNLCREMWTIYCWLRLLDPEYEEWINQPENWQFRWLTEINVAALEFFASPDYENLKVNAQNYIKKADVVTVNLGANETGTNASMSYLYKTLYYMGGLALTPALIYKEDGTINFPTSIEQVISMVGGYKAYNDELAQGVEDFKEAYDMLIERIYELNPDIEVYTIGMYNMFRDADPQQDNVQLYLANAAYNTTTSINSYLRSGSKWAKKTHFVDVTETTVYPSESIYSTGYIMHFVTRCHPNAAGHKHMANQIIDAINGNAKVDMPVIKKGSEGWGYYNQNNNLCTYYNGLGKNSKGTVYVLKNGVINSSFSGYYGFKGKTYYIKKGKLQSSFSGTKKTSKYTYTIKNGVVTKKVKN